MTGEITTMKHELSRTAVVLTLFGACGGDGDAGSSSGGSTSTSTPADVDAGSTAPAEDGSASTAAADETTVDDDGDTSSGGASDESGPGPIECRVAGDGITTITFVNGCAESLSYRGSMIDGGELAPGEHACHDLGDAIAEIPAIRYWGFVGPDPGGERHTLAELTLNTDFNDFDWYNISHVDAHNLPMAIVPFGMDDCRTLSCPDSLLRGCPRVGQVFIDDVLVSCFSPERDNPDSPVAQYFEAGCADAYSWSGDDAESVATCAGEDFDVVFCP